MKGRTHTLLAGAAAFTACQALGVSDDAHVVVIGAATVVANVPDLDRHYDRGARRSVTHSLLATALFVAAVHVTAFTTVGSVLAAALGLGVAVGYGAHVLADACTQSGVPFFWPYRRMVHLLPRGWRFTTGSAAETILGVVIVAGLAVYVYDRLPLGV